LTASLSCSRLLCRSRRCLCPAKHFHSKFILSLYHTGYGWLFQWLGQKIARETFKKPPKKTEIQMRAMFVYNSSYNQKPNSSKKKIKILGLKFLFPVNVSKLRSESRSVWSYKWSPENITMRHTKSNPERAELKLQNVLEIEI